MITVFPTGNFTTNAIPSSNNWLKKGTPVLLIRGDSHWGAIGTNSLDAREGTVVCGTCSSPSSQRSKIVNIPFPMRYTEAVLVSVRFENDNTNDAPTMSIVTRGHSIYTTEIVTSDGSPVKASMIKGGNTYFFTYNQFGNVGSEWKFVLLNPTENLVNAKVSLPIDTGNPDYGAAGQYAVSDGEGGITWSDGVIINSSTEGSTKKFRLTVDDSGAISATEVV